MKRLIALATILLTTALYSEPPVRYDLDHVGLSVQLASSWQLQGQDSVIADRPDGVSTEYGFTYLVDADISHPSMYRFDEVLIERFDNLDDTERERFVSGEYRAGSSEDIELVGTGPLPIEVPEFEDTAVFRYRQHRGDAAYQQSAGYMLFAVDGSSAYRLKVGGLDQQFRFDTGRYRHILESVRVQPSDEPAATAPSTPRHLFTAGG